MKFVKLIACLFLVMSVCSTFTANGKGKVKGMYLAGVSASFSDSLIYFTDVQFVDSVSLDKEKLLPLRDKYSDQMDYYLEKVQGQQNRTCFIYFNANKSKLEKKMNKMKAKYQKDGKSILRDTGADFKFVKAVEE